MDTSNAPDVYIDFEDGLRRVGGNNDLYKRLLGIFVKGDHLGPIDSAISDGNLTEAAHAAHSLKGVSANLSLKKLHAISAELETKLKNGLDHTGSYDELKAVFHETLGSINNI